MAVWLVKPVGVSTHFVVLDGIVWNLHSPELITRDNTTLEYESSNAYLNKSGGKYASLVANPMNYGFIFVLSMFVGGFLSGKLSGNKESGEDKTAPEVWRNRFGSSVKTLSLCLPGRFPGALWGPSGRGV